MGLIVLEIEVGNPANPEVTEKVEFLIDSGAIYSVVPTPILERLDIRTLAEQQFRLADGSKQTQPVRWDSIGHRRKKWETER